MAKILLVEDDNNLREIYQARMQAEGYIVVTASDGEAALALAAKEKPDLIISDVMMPKISGFEMLDILRNTDGLKNTKVIMLTALGQAEDKTRADALGADKYLVKSQVTLEDIVNTARNLLVEAGAETAPAAPAPIAAAPAAPQVVPAPTTPAPIGTPTPQQPQIPPPNTPQPATTAQPTLTTPVPTPTPVSPNPAAAPVTQQPIPVVIPVATPPAAQPQNLSTPPPSPVPTPTPVSPTSITPASTEAVDDNVISSAVEQLLTSVNQPTTIPAVTQAQPAAQSQPPAPQPAPVAPPTPQTTGTNSTETDSLPHTSVPPQPVTSISGSNVEVAGKKIITPISSPDAKKPTLDELLAKENGHTIAATPTINQSPDFTQPQPGASVTPSSGFDPNSISL